MAMRSKVGVVKDGFMPGKPKKSRQGQGKNTKYAATSRNNKKKVYRVQRVNQEAVKVDNEILWHVLLLDRIYPYYVPAMEVWVRKEDLYRLIKVGMVSLYQQFILGRISL